MSKNENRPLIRRHISLEEVLQLATPDELVAIADILLDKDNDRLLGDGPVRKRLAQCYQAGELFKAVKGMAFEIRALGSVSFASLLRKGEPVSYDEVVRDVASELKVEFSKADSTAIIEAKVLTELLQKLAEQVESESQESSGAWFGRERLKTSFSSVLGPLGKMGLGRRSWSVAVDCGWCCYCRCPCIQGKGTAGVERADHHCRSYSPDPRRCCRGGSRGFC